MTFGPWVLDRTTENDDGSFTLRWRRGSGSNGRKTTHATAEQMAELARKYGDLGLSNLPKEAA